MKFRLFGVDVEIQMFFWLTTALFAWPDLKAGRFDHAAAWVAVVFVSVLVHELGHALAVKRHKIEPSIALHGMGGTTSWMPGASISRVDHILISLAGPFAGFALGGLVIAFQYFAPGLVGRLPLLAQYAMSLSLWVNIGWGLVNLIPVLPFDGGHVLEHALGPKRGRLTAMISGTIGALVAIYAGTHGWIWMALLFGMGAIQSFQRFNAEPASAGASSPRRSPSPTGDEIPAELAALLQSARSALAEEQLARAISLAESVLAEEQLPPRAGVLALEIIAWAHLLQDDPREAARKVETAQKLGNVDAALLGATLHATGDLVAARRVLEGAFSKGDHRKEVVGPLIQVLIQQGEVPRAAAVALDIVETLSQDDVRKMAEIALDNRAFEWAARLLEQSFARAPGAEDAYAAARAHALAGQHDRAVEWLRYAVAAGFSDRARAWSDAALEALRTGPDLEAVLPRPRA
jgi:Zn-dependent protease